MSVTRFETFASLHVPGKPVVLYNVWDAGSAQAVAAAGAKAIATGSPTFPISKSPISS